MHIKKAIVSLAVIYTVLVLTGTLVMAITSLEIGDVSLGIIMIIPSITLVFMVSREYYFRGEKTENKVNSGFMLGGMLFISVIILDYLLMGIAMQNGWNVFLMCHLVILYPLFLFVPVLAAITK